MINNLFFILANDSLTIDDNGSLIQAIFILLLFVAIMFGAYYTSKFVGKHQMNRTKNSNLKIIEVIQVSPGKTVQLIKTGEEFILIGVSKENITFLKSIDKENINLEYMKQFSQAPVSFKEQFQKILDKKNIKNK
jgi:flagellar protein FliO/FliZ